MLTCPLCSRIVDTLLHCTRDLLLFHVSVCCMLLCIMLFVVMCYVVCCYVVCCYVLCCVCVICIGFREE